MSNFLVQPLNRKVKDEILLFCSNHSIILEKSQYDKGTILKPFYLEFIFICESLSLGTMRNVFVYNFCTIYQNHFIFRHNNNINNRNDSWEFGQNSSTWRHMTSCDVMLTKMKKNAWRHKFKVVTPAKKMTSYQRVCYNFKG